MERLKRNRVEGVVYIDGLDDAILGYAGGVNAPAKPMLIYSVKEILDILQKRDNMTREEAIEYYEFNIASMYAGETTPIFLEDLE